ncbi:MAG TPA: carboxypeptidase regulatory-like domain-containing protein [Gemmataceae bacterium]|nr:carboxypeptidase regulatory-like domain-containing protein [Gemmataceae bacterium]
MTNRMQTAIVLLVLAQGLAGCDSSRSSIPSAPTPMAPLPATPASSNLMVFTDTASGLSTSDVHDAQDQMVQFNRAGELIWTAGGSRFPGWGGDYAYLKGPEKLCDCWFEVRFGAKDGQRLAYLIADDGKAPGTIVDLEVVDGTLVLTQSHLYPPGTSTLSGVVTEATPTGPMPLAGALLHWYVSDFWREATTDRNGFYTIPGVYDQSSVLDVSLEGYQTLRTAVTIRGDTRFDIQLQCCPN